MNPVKPRTARVAPTSAPSSLLTLSLLLAAALVGVRAQAQTPIVNYTTPYTISTFAGTAYVPGDVDGTGTAVQFYEPQGVAIDPNGNVYVADTGNNVVRKIAPGGVTTTFAGSSGPEGVGSADGTGSAAKFNGPLGIGCDSQGNVYVSDIQNSTIRKITPAGVVTTLAGLATHTGTNDGTGSNAQFDEPAGLVVDKSGNIYVADYLNSSVREVTPAGVVTTVAGVNGAPGIADGTGSIAKFNTPYGIATDGNGNFYIADTGNLEVRKMTSTFAVTTIAGKSKNPGDVDATGTSSRFKYPTGVAVDGNGNIYVVDSGNLVIREINPSSLAVSTYVGTGGVAGFTNGTGAAAQFEDPIAIAATSGGTLYIADSGSSLIKEVAPGAVVTTYAGQPFSGFLDGSGSAAQLDTPTGVAVDSSGNVYVADQFNDLIRKITPAGVVTTLAGSPGNTGSADGTGSAAQFNNPNGVAVDGSGNVYVADSTNDTIRKITSSGVVTTIAGQPKQGGSSNGNGTAALFNNPAGIAVDSNGNVYVSEAGNYDIR
jgi:sugar lactone lactonase YvrE